MTRITPQTARTSPRRLSGWQDTDEAWENDSRPPLTTEQARQWRARHPQLPVARVLLMQAATGCVVAALAWGLTRSATVGCSAVYGALVSVVPTALAARGTARWAAPGFPPGAALAGFLLWELVKLVLAVGMLVAAPRILGTPSWPVLLISLALTIKVYWVGMLLAHSMRSGQERAQKKVETNGC
ncbi:MAG: ATP synthase subunit I [Burkholderiaceae bacterium]|jgi:ATP synthase protein I|nr:ATP synthase subunit I [Burkholderiaceae bacterium]